MFPARLALVGLDGYIAGFVSGNVVRRTMIGRPSSRGSSLLSLTSTTSGMTGLRNRHLLVADVALLATSPLLLYALRFEGLAWGHQNVRTALTFLVCAIPLQITTYYLFGLYR